MMPEMIISSLNSFAQVARLMMFWHTPYRTGNLALNAYGDIRTMYAGNWGYVVGFDMFNRPGTEYGPLLNEAQIIHYNVVAPWNGQRYQGSYANRHFGWCDRGADNIANEATLYLPVRRIA